MAEPGSFTQRAAINNRTTPQKLPGMGKPDANEEHAQTGMDSANEQKKEQQFVKDEEPVDTESKGGRNSPVTHKTTGSDLKVDSITEEFRAEQETLAIRGGMSLEENMQGSQEEEEQKGDKHVKDLEDLGEKVEALKKENTEKGRHIERLQQDMERLQLENNKMEKEMKEQKNAMLKLDDSLEDRMKEMSTTLGKPLKAVELADNRKGIEGKISRLQDLLEHAVMEKSQLEQLLKQSEGALESEERRSGRLDEQVKDLTMRLSHEMDAKVSARESTIENVNIKNRPMRIKDDYLQLCSDQWQEAKETVDRLSEGEADNLRLLCDIILISYDEAEKALKGLYDGIINPLGDVTENAAGDIMRVKSLPQNLHTELSNYLKRSSDNISMVKLEQSIFDQLDSTCSSPSHADSQDHITSRWPLVKEADIFKSYVSVACRLAWNMVIQRPPMRFTTDGIGEEWKGEKIQDLYWTSINPTSERAKVICYVYPALWQEDKLKTPGKVLLRND